MAKITLSFPKEFKEKMDKHPEINWPAVIRRIIIENIKKLERFEELNRRGEL